MNTLVYRFLIAMAATIRATAATRTAIAFAMVAARVVDAADACQCDN